MAKADTVKKRPVVEEHTYFSVEPDMEILYKTNDDMLFHIFYPTDGAQWWYSIYDKSKDYIAGGALTRQTNPLADIDEVTKYIIEAIHPEIIYDDCEVIDIHDIEGISFYLRT